MILFEILNNSNMRLAILLAVALQTAAGCLIRGGAAPKAKIGDRFSICLEVNDRNRTVFNPEVDKLSALALTGCA